MNDQTAPFPTDLEELIHEIEYKGWEFYLIEDYDRGQGSRGLTLSVTARVQDTYHDDMIRINHLFIVPAAAYGYESWRRWLLDQVLLIEQHEACEFFKIKGERPFAPHHGPGENPYTIYEHGTDEQVRTSFRGELADGNG